VIWHGSLKNKLPLWIHFTNDTYYTIMNHRHLFFILFLSYISSLSINAQNATATSSNLKASAITDRTVYYSVNDSGVKRSMLWGLDTAWPSAENIKRGIAFMGANNIDIVRASFQPSHPLENGDLSQKQIDSLKLRLNLINLVGKNTKVALNDDPMDGNGVNAWYKGNADRWAQLIDVTTRRVQESGHPVVSVAPFNEPDYGWNQGTITDFKNIIATLKSNSRFDTIRISGGNTLNDDQALSWYNTLKSNLDEGNTHQLAGSFDNFAKFYQQVKTDGKFATGDELHNVMEPMVGLEYGMQEGIWWGTAEHTRGEFVKASKGARLGYAEHRDKWTAASVYRNPNGQIIGFGGTSERQANTTTYRFASKDCDVYYDGVGPTREYTITLPGGTGYQKGQSNAECMVNISFGDDIQPAIGGTYYIVNRNSHLVIMPESSNTNDGAPVRQYSYTGKNTQQWNVTPVSTTIGGDFSYFTIANVSSGKSIDDNNWSFDNNNGMIMYTLASGNNQQWCFEYASDGWFYIRNRHSGKYLQVYASSKSKTAEIVQNPFYGTAAQQWRLVPATSSVEFTAPAAPSELKATPNAESVSLSWTPSADTDLKGYEILRANAPQGKFNSIARYVETNSFIDNSAHAGDTYYYTVRAEDKALNRSLCSDTISAAATGEKALVTEYNFEDTTTDRTINMNDCSLYGTETYVTGKVDNKAISIGSSNFLQLPYTIANYPSITISAWVYWNGYSQWQRIFDFGNGESQYMFLTPSATSSQMRFTIKNGGDEQLLNAPILTKRSWKHVAVTMGDSKVCIYVDGALAASTTDITIKPNDIKPIFNYIGRSQFASDPLFTGYIDDFRIYNYELSADEIKSLAGITSGISTAQEDFSEGSFSVYDMNGKLVGNDIHSKEIQNNSLRKGTYIIKKNNSTKMLTKKIIIEK
jgi:hypothetical protein